MTNKEKYFLYKVSSRRTKKTPRQLAFEKLQAQQAVQYRKQQEARFKNVHGVSKDRSLNAQKHRKRQETQYKKNKQLSANKHQQAANVSKSNTAAQSLNKSIDTYKRFHAPQQSAIVTQP
jgi:hypothetical protein